MANNYDWDDDFDDSELEDWDYKPKAKTEPVKPSKEGKPKKGKKIAVGNVALHAASIRCPSCGANISVDTSLKTAVCEYCGSKYNVGEAVKKSEAIMGAVGNTAKSAGRAASKAASGAAKELGRHKKLCENCGTEIAITAKRCYKCGHKNPVPIYRKTWFWIVIAVIFLSMISSCRSCLRKRAEEKEWAELAARKTSDDFTDIKWPDSALAKMLPEPKNVKRGMISSDRYDSFVIYIGDYSKADYEEYVSQIKALGFTEEYNGSDHYYSAKNAEGYEIRVEHSDEEGDRYMEIRLHAPEEPEPEEVIEETTPEPTEEPVEENSEEEEPVPTDEDSASIKEDISEKFNELNEDIPDEIKNALQGATDKVLDYIDPSRNCEKIYQEYQAKLKDKSQEYQNKINDAAANGADIGTLAEIQGEGVNELAQINAEGVDEMADYTYKFYSIGKYDDYIKYSGQLWDDYMNEGTTLYDLYMEKGMESYNNEVDSKMEEYNRQVEEMMNNLNFDF